MTTTITKASYDGSMLRVEYGDGRSIEANLTTSGGCEALTSICVDVGIHWLDDTDDLVGRTTLDAAERDRFKAEYDKRQQMRAAVVSTLSRTTLATG